MQKKSLLLLLLTLLWVNAHSQTLFEDAKGESSMYLSRDPWFYTRINTSDESVTLGYNRLRKSGYDGHASLLKSFRFFYGGDLKVKVDNGSGNLLSSGKLSPGGALSFNLGIQGRDTSKTTMNDYMLYLRGGVNYDKYSLIDTLNFQSVEPKKYTAFAELHFNKIWVRNYDTSKQNYFIMGLSFGVKGTNNIDNLNDGTFNVTEKVKDSITIVTTKNGKLGDYKGYTSLPFKADFGFIPRILKQNMVGFNIYGRADFNMPHNPVSAGGGVFFTSKDSPTSIVGGLAYQYSDIFNKTDLAKNSSIFFYVGYTIK